MRNTNLILSLNREMEEVNNYKHAVRWLVNFLVTNDRPEQEFDYPDYWGMPEGISSKLSPEHVDRIQSLV